MNEKFNKNAKVEKFTTMLGIAVRLIVIDPLISRVPVLVDIWGASNNKFHPLSVKNAKYCYLFW